MIKNLEQKECINILENNYIGHLGYIYKSVPYVVPITYYFDRVLSHIICYSGEGHKTIAMRKNNLVSLQVGDTASVTNWKSVLVLGTYEQLFGSEAKSLLHEFSLGVKDVIYRREFKVVDFISEFSSKVYKNDLPIVYRIVIDEIIGKKRKV